MTVATTSCPSSTVPCFTSLPVELVEFYSVCENGSPLVIWTTASEVNNDYFILERVNLDGTFTTLTTMNGAGNSQNEITYSFSDTQASNELTYYRLTQVDFDGTHTVFDIISAKNCSSHNSTTVHYSAENHQLLLFNSERQLENLKGFTLITMIGNQVITDDVIAQNSMKSSVRLRNHLATGNYLVHLQFHDREEVVKLFVH